MGAESIVNNIKEIFSNFNQSVQDAINIVTTAPESNSGMWSLVSNVQETIIPVALTLMTLYFFIGFLQKAIMLDYMKWENIVKSLLRLVVCNVLVQKTMDIMTLIFNVTVELATSIGNAGTINITELEYDKLTDSLSSMSLWDRIGYWGNTQPIVLIMNIVLLILMLIVYGRMIQIYVYTAFAPIPLSSIAGEGFGATAKHFLKDYAGVCLQGPVIIFSITLFGAKAQEILTSGDVSIKTLGQILLMGLVVLFIMIKSSDWAKKIIGN